MVEVRERVKEKEAAEQMVATPPPLVVESVKMVPRERKKRVEEHLATHEDEPRFQHELKEMQEVHDLDEIDDDVETEATLYEWRALEHEHRPKSPVWFAILAAGTTVVVGIQLVLFNFFGAIVMGLIGAMTYYIAQKEPEEARYRIMLDGIAIDNLLYHWQDLETFNVVYEPDQTRTVIFRSKRTFSPYIHMEIGEADPVEIRDVLIEFLEENQEMHEPISDVIARRLGF